MSQSNNLKEKLKEKLKEIFQFESEDLDFGIYKIMNYKRKEIKKFIEEELINEIKKRLVLLSGEERKEIEKKLKEISSKNGVKKYLEALQKGDKERAKIYREDFTKDIEEYERLRRQLEEIKISEDLEKAIYNHLINFFSRYYDNGDFISKRRYGKNEKYVIPYNGEEVLLYWANKDQYYIKTTEYFRRYTFRIKELIVNFRIIEAEEEKGNIKSVEKKFFVLNEKFFDFNKEKRELNIYFEYRGLTEEEEEKYKHGQSASQDRINEEIVKVLKEKVPQNSLARLIFEKDPNSENGKTYIEKHLYKYTRRNTTDYFIHKDLKGFLERELDFYIKNEFLNLDDLKVLEESGYFDKLRLYLIGVRAFRNIALKIIEFLAQIENFQKMIWEKKKFIIDTHYVITLDKIKKYAGEEFLESILDEILSNEKQLEEWKELFGIEVKRKEELIESNTSEGKEWKKLPIDTKYFDEEFKWKLLVALTKENNLDEILDGILIKSENWQALNLLLNKYYEKAQTIYIDPPFNTGGEFLYKDNYQDSTWLTLMENRLSLSKYFLKDTGNIYCHFDHNSNYLARFLLDMIFGSNNFRNEIIWKRLTYKQTQVKGYGVLHDTILYYTKTDNYLWTDYRVGYDEERISKYFCWVETPDGRNIKLSKAQLEGKEPIPEGRRFALNPLINVNPDRPNLKYEFLGFVRTWKYTKEKMLEYYKKGIVFQPTPGSLPQKKQYLDESEGMKLNDIWTDISGVMGGSKEYLNFDTQKPEALLKRIILASSNTNDIVLDFFLGSGTTTAVAQKLKRKWIGIEMGDYFEHLVLPRMKEVLAGFGKHEPCGISKEEKWQGGGFFKYHTLEQYEDALENIEFEKPQKTLYEFSDYFIKYMLEWETKNSKTFLNLDEMKDPFNYKLKIIENYQQKTINVDLVETFNYLIGLNVSRYEVLQENGRKYVFVFGEKDGKRIAIVWRSIKDIDFEKDKEIIEAKLKELESDEIYINGEALVKGFRHIELQFKALMFKGGM